MMLVTIDLICSVMVVMVLYRWVNFHRLLVKPRLFHFANLIFLLGMLPWLDSLARYSICLHSAQSVMVHHIAPLLWIMAVRHPIRAYSNETSSKPHWYITALLSLFSILTWGWMLPAIHPLLMQSALAYALMKWVMALSGLALCFSMLTWSASSDYWKRLNGMTVTLPLVILGGVMVTIPDLYQSVHAGMHHHHMMMTNIPNWLQLSPNYDQLLGGIIFLFAAYFYWKKESFNQGVWSYVQHDTE